MPISSLSFLLLTAALVRPRTVTRPAQRFLLKENEPICISSSVEICNCKVQKPFLRRVRFLLNLS